MISDLDLNLVFKFENAFSKEKRIQIYKYIKTIVLKLVIVVGKCRTIGV